MVINKEKNFASVVVYSYNSEDYIEKFLDKINKFFKDNFEHFEIISVTHEDSPFIIFQFLSLSFLPLNSIF